MPFGRISPWAEEHAPRERFLSGLRELESSPETSVQTQGGLRLSRGTFRKIGGGPSGRESRGTKVLPFWRAADEGRPASSRAWSQWFRPQLVNSWMRPLLFACFDNVPLTAYSPSNLYVVTDFGVPDAKTMKNVYEV